MANSNEILLYQQGNDVASVPDGFAQVSNPLHPNKRTTSRFSHFPSDVYDLSPETHLARLIKVLLGDAGVGQLHKRNMLARLQATVGGTNFFDLDAFYGAVLGVRRRRSELLVRNPSTELLTPTEWDQARIRDGAYRSRIEQFAKGLHLGATKGGIEAVAEALLGIQCDVIEMWERDDQITRTWGDLEAVGTWGDLEALGTWGNLEQGTSHPYKFRHIIKVIPHRVLTSEEEASAQQAIARIRPAGALIVIAQPPMDATTTIPISRLFADSEHWEVRSTVRNSLVNGTTLLYDGVQDALVPISPPAWGSYQGEAWTLMASNPTLVAYTTPTAVSTTDAVDPAAIDIPPQKTYVNGREIIFSAINATLSVQTTLAGRAASDGVLACNPQHSSSSPSTTPVGFPSISTIAVPNDPAPAAEVYVDGVPIDSLVSVFGTSKSGRVPSIFWTAPVRPIGAADDDILEVRFPAEGEFNTVTFEIAAFPQTVSIQAWKPSAGRWETIYSTQYYTSNPAGITGAIPPDSVHPYHYGNNHWVKIRASVTPTQASAVRFVLKHTTQGSMPTGFDGQPVGYPLGLRGIDIGFRLNDLSLVPNTDLSSPIATTQNILGQPVQHSVVKFEAGLAANNSEDYWKCEAQPIAKAVVNLYLDISDSLGNPSTFDRLYLDPYCSGPTMNIYWAIDAPDTADLAVSPSREQNVMPSVVQGSLTTISSGDAGIQWPDVAEAWFDFNNTDLGLDLRRSFWWAAEFYPNFPTTLIPDDAALFSAGTEIDAVYSGDFAVTFHATGEFTFHVAGRSISSSDWSWVPGQKLTLCGSWDETTQTLVCGVLNPDGTFLQQTGGTGTYTAPVSSFPTFRVGRSLGSDAGNAKSADIRLLKFVVGYGNPDLETATATLDSYVRKPRYQSVGADNTAGTVLRYHPSYEGRNSSGGFSYGWMGGHIDLWSGVQWFPIGQDFVLSRGQIRLPVTRARYVKLEFSDLVAEPFEPFLSHDKVVKVHSSATTSTPEPSGRAISGEPTPISPDAISAGGRFSLGSQGRNPLSNENVDPYLLRPSPTVGLVASEPVSALQLSGRAGYGFGFKEWQSRRLGSQFVSVGKHVYDEVVLAHSEKVAFFVGVREVQVGRSQGTAPLDTAAYDDPFFDFSGIESSTANYDPGIFYTAQTGAPGILGTPLVVTSATFASITDVTAVQFATQQTPPQQIVYDDKFRDPALVSSDFTDMQGWHSFEDGRVFWDPARQGVLVTRDPTILYTQIDIDTPIIHPPVTPIFSSSAVLVPTIDSGSIGGISTPDVPISEGGVLNVAVRLTPDTDLSGPLYIQLYGSDGTTVLAEHEFTSLRGVMVEAVLSYIIGSNPGLDSTFVSAKVVQKGPYQDSWIMHAFSIFDDSILWEFSNDGGTTWVPALNVRNNYAGVVAFPYPGNSVKWRCTMYRQSLGIDKIRIRPWYRRRIGSG